MIFIYENKMDKKIKLQENLNALLGSGKVSLTVAARRAKMNKSTLHGYMNGVVPRTIKNLILLSDVLKVSPSTLLFGDVNSKNNDSKKSVKAHFNGFKEGRFEVTIKSLEIEDEDELP